MKKEALLFSISILILLSLNFISAPPPPQNATFENVNIINNLTVGNNLSATRGFFSFLGSAASRITKGWFTDLDVINLVVDTNTLFVDSSNNRVGIGTTTPQNTLNVVGTTNFTGNTTSNIDFCIVGGNCLSSVGSSGGISPPIGAVLPWLKSFINTPLLPNGWVESNGQILNDSESVYNGQTIPNLNGNAQFLYGASTSGNTKTENFLPSHSHTTTREAAQGNRYNEGTFPWASLSTSSASAGTAWEAYSVVWIMRVK